MRSAEVPMFLPQLRPRLARRPAEKNFGVVFALFVMHALGVAVVPGQAAAGEEVVGLLRGQAENDQRCRRRRGVAAQPFGVGGADRFGEGVGAAENFDGSVLAVVAGSNSEKRLLLRGQRIANLRHGSYQLIPANLLPQVAVLRK